MSSLIENLEKAAKVNTELTELIREAHSAIRAMRQTEREVLKAVEEARKEALGVIDSAVAEKFKDQIEAVTEEINTSLAQISDHTIKEFDKIANPLMKAVQATQDYAEAHQLNKQIGGLFFDRG